MRDTKTVHGKRSEHRSPLQVSWFIEWEGIVFPIAPFFLDQTKILNHLLKKNSKLQQESGNVWLLEKVWCLVGKRCKLESSHAEDTSKRSSNLWTIEKMEVHRHLCLVSLGSWIKAFLPSVFSTEIIPDVRLVLTGSENPDETYSWPWCWTA